MNLINVALAEETASAAASSLHFIDIFLIGVGIYYLVCGIMTLLKKKIYDGTAKSYAKYTDESVQRAIPFLGWMDVMIGIGFIFFNVLQFNLIPAFNNTAVKWVGTGIILAAAIGIACYMQFKVLKKKPAENQ